MSDELAEEVKEETLDTSTEEKAPQEQDIEASNEAQPEPTAEEKHAIDKKKAEDAFQKRANKMTSQKYAEKERADKAEARLAEIEAKQNNQELSIENFDYDEDALLNAKIKQGIQQGIATNAEQQRQATQDAERAKITVKFNEKVVEANFDNYKEVVDQLSSVRPPLEMIDVILSDENGPQMAYYLGSNLNIADEIATASPYKAGKMLSDISKKIANNKPKKKLTTASDPVQTIQSSGSIKKDYATMSMSEIMATPP
jgi:hypothetical protein